MKAYEQIIDFMAKQEEGAVVNRKEVQAALGIPERTLKRATKELSYRRDLAFEVVYQPNGVFFHKNRGTPVPNGTPEVAPPEKMAPLELEVGTPSEEMAPPELDDDDAVNTEVAPPCPPKPFLAAVGMTPAEAKAWQSGLMAGRYLHGLTPEEITVYARTNAPQALAPAARLDWSLAMLVAKQIKERNTQT